MKVLDFTTDANHNQDTAATALEKLLEVLGENKKELGAQLPLMVILSSRMYMMANHLLQVLTCIEKPKQ